MMRSKLASLWGSYSSLTLPSALIWNVWRCWYMRPLTYWIISEALESNASSLHMRSKCGGTCELYPSRTVSGVKRQRTGSARRLCGQKVLEERESAPEGCPLTCTRASWCCSHASKMNKQMCKRYEGREVTEEVLTGFLLCKSETDGQMTVKITAALQSVAGIRTPRQSRRLFLHACLSLSAVLLFLHLGVELLTELVL